MEMNDTERFLLIVMTKSATRKLAEDGIGDIEKQLREIDNIRLYNRPGKVAKNSENSGESIIALPLESGIVLLLRKSEEDNYFVCISIARYPRPPAGSAYYHELPSNVLCCIKFPARVRSYFRSAVDCNEIKREVMEKNLWRPFESGGPEGKKWKAYLDLYRNMMEGRRFGLPVKVHKIDGKNVEVTPDFSGMPDNDSAEIEGKINKARNSEISFSLTLGAIGVPHKRYFERTFGKLASFNNGRMKIRPDKKFHDSLKKDIKEGIMEGIFYPKRCANDDKPIVSSSGENPVTEKEDTDKKSESTDNAEQGKSNENESEMTVEFFPIDGLPYDFYYDPEGTKLAFSCRAEDDKDEHVWRINPDSIILGQMMLFAEFVGDLYQINVMSYGLRDIKGCDIWPVLSGERVAKLPEIEDISWDDSRLNNQQKEAVQKALGAEELCLIWGPPGTGKTEVIMEIAQREAARGNKTLIVSQANLAVDNALARLDKKPGVWAFRIAKEDYKLEEDDMNKVPMEETAGDFFSRWLQDRLHKKSAESEQGEESEQREDVIALREDLLNALKKSRKSGAEREMPQMAELYRRRINIVGATLMETGKVKWETDPDTGRTSPAGNKICNKIGIKEFDTVIVDEVSKATPPELFLPALLGKRLVLVGDHKQLPPMFKLISGDDLSLEEWAMEAGVPEEELDINSTLFEKLWEKHNGAADGVRAKLTMQYRMHKDIQHLIDPFYADSEGTLECGIPSKNMAKMAITSDSCLDGHHAVWVDTENDALEGRSGTSFVNDDEVRIVGKLLETLPRDEKLSVGVITFYGAQLGQLREKYERKFSEKFPGKLIFGTVDRFQGRECDVVICSLVRKNKQGSIGFASKPNRINVAFSRARRLLCIVGNRGQFCYEAKSKKPRTIYTKIHRACKELHESDFS